MKKPNIYPDRRQELLALFEGAGNPSKLMCVPVDYPLGGTELTIEHYGESVVKGG